MCCSAIIIKLLKGHREDGREDNICGKVQRRGGGEHATETNAQVDHNNRGALTIVVVKFIEDESKS
jgi:hypothetical protein